jgi:hypothetical protein
MTNLRKRTYRVIKSFLTSLLGVFISLLRYIREKQVFRVFNSFLIPLLGIFVSLLAINQTIFSIQKSFNIGLVVSEPSLAMIMTASIALTSLYLAWLEFILKRKPFVMAKWIPERNEGEDELYLKLINMGDRPVGLTSFDWAFVEQKESELYFTNRKYESFNKDKLGPHEEIKCKLGENIYQAEVNNLSVLRPDGREFEVGSPRKYPFTYVHSLSDKAHDFQREIREVFREIMSADYDIGRQISLEEFEENEVEELTADIEQNQMNFWARLNQWYQEKVYDIRVIGSIGRDPITKLLSWLSVRKTRKEA